MESTGYCGYLATDVTKGRKKINVYVLFYRLPFAQMTTVKVKHLQHIEWNMTSKAQILNNTLDIQSNTMETISLKLEDDILSEIDKKLVAHRYSTRTEFIRDAIREKLSDLEKAELLKSLVRLHGSSKKKTTDAQLERVCERAFDLLDKVR